MSALYLAVFALSAATLIFEIALTRVFSVAQWYHFAFMTVSLALLGFGASGTLLALSPQLLKRDLAKLLTTLCLTFSVSVVGSYLTSNHVPFDSFQIAYDQRQLIYLAIYYLSLAVPFFFTGIGIGVLLAALPDQAGKIYFANLLGSGLGCPLALAMLSLAGGEGAIILASLLGALAALGLGHRRSWLCFGLALGLAILLTACLVRPPDIFEIKMSPYKALSHALRYPGARVAYRGWNAFSRVDVVESEGIRSAAGLSYTYPDPLPPQNGVFTDGDNLSPLTASSPGTDLGFLDSVLVSLPYKLLSRTHVLILEPGAGLDVLLAVHNEADDVVAVDSNPLVIAVVRDRYGHFAGNLYSRADVTIVAEDGRSYVHRSAEKFDIIQVSLDDTFKPVSSGGYSLSENYIYTTEAFVDYLNHLTPHGVLVVHRWLQTPPSESVRALALALSALQSIGIEDPAQHVVALRSLYTALLLVKRQGFTSQEIDIIRSFSQDKRFDLIYYPGIGSDEPNRYSVLQEPHYYNVYREVLENQDRPSFYADYPFDISPPSDDRPFFFHFFRWQQTTEIMQTLGKTWQPFGGSGYFVLLALFILALFASSILILLPLSFLRGRGEVRQGKRLFLYFLLLGVGYLFVEIPLLQRFILFLGHPSYAFAAVLFTLLTFSGLGSLLSPRLSLRKALVGLIIAITCYPLLLPHLFRWLLGGGLIFRLLASVIMLAPLGFLMGFPFPKGIRLTGKIAPRLIPWAWGLNGCASVLSSILAVMIAISYGFSWVLVAGGVAYALALAAIYALTTRTGTLAGPGAMIRKAETGAS
jgi:spermidine synthase